MTCNAAFIYSDEYLSYRFSPDHPFNQQRVLLTKELLESEGKLSNEMLIPPRYATIEELSLVHSKRYIEAVRQAGKGTLSSEEGWQYGLGTEDTPMFADMHEAASLLVGGTLAAVDAVLQNKVSHALNLGGGLHHGFRDRASGFCIYNDGAVAIKYIKEKYKLRVLYVDTDAHHGDGVQNMFYDDPDVCTLSIHETGRYLFPGTGNVNERGVRTGYGYSFNFPVDAFTEDDSFLTVYESAFREVVAFFQPDVIVTQNGTDAHYYDPLTHLSSTMKTYETIPLLAHRLAHEYCQGRWVALGGGGYDIWRVVPRAWAQIWSVMVSGDIFQGSLPGNWLNKWQPQAPVSLPETWHDTEGLYKAIPRKKEIEEKNKKMLQQALKFTENSKNHNKV